MVNGVSPSRGFAPPVSSGIFGVRRPVVPLCPADISPLDFVLFGGGNPGVLQRSASGRFAQPVSTGIFGVRRPVFPLCPSDISPVNGGKP